MKTKDRIQESLCRLMHEKTFENITVKEICEKADVNRSTYYRNFSSKEDIIKYKLENILDEYIEEFEGQEDTSRQNYINTILATFSRHKEFFKTIHKHNQTYLLQNVLTEYFSVKDNVNDKKELYRSYYHIGGICSFTICWIENGMEDDISELSEIGAQLADNAVSLYGIN